jgi:NAD(P)H-nitrite reductase large subunit
MEKKHTVIIGNGIAGITTARHLRKASKQQITVISAESRYFFSRTALMYVYMGHMKFEHIQPYENWFWEKNQINLMQDRVVGIDAESQRIQLEKGEALHYDQLVLATGSKPAFYGWRGQDLKHVQGLFSVQDLEKLEASTPAPGQTDHPTKKAVIAGGGLIGIELAEMLLYRGVQVTMLVREPHFWGNVITRNESQIVTEHAVSHGLEIRFGAELQEILGDEEGRASAVLLTSGEKIDCQLVGITTGVKPNIDFLKNTPLEINRGIVVNEYLETNLPNIYAAGDCAEIREPRQGRRAIEPVWYTGRMMGEVLGITLSGKKTKYNPGPWFNSAKFFDIEYQTYGNVQPQSDDNQAHWFWRKPGANKFATVAYHPETLEFQGINGFGIRLAHRYFDKALQLKKSVGEVIGGIAQANFDPEFYGKWARDFKIGFTRDTGIDLKKDSRIKQLFTR